MSDAYPDDGLESRARDLTDEVGQLRLSVNQLGRRTERAERNSFRTAIAVAVMLVLVVLIGVNAYQQYQTAARLEQVVQKVNCPFYALILGSYDPNGRPLNPDGSYPGSPREKYEQGFAEMRIQHDALECRGELIPPRTAD